MSVEDRRKQGPGIEKHSAFSHAEQAYRHYFDEALRVLTHPAMTEDIRAHAQDLSAAYASARTEKQFGLEEQIRRMSERILQAGDEIIRERDWNATPDGNSFAWQLKGTDSENAQSLRLSARTGTPISLVKLRLRESRSRQIKIAEFADVPDVLIGASKERLMRRLMLDLFVDLSVKLGFISNREELSSSPRVKREGRCYRIIHPIEPFFIRFTDFSPKESAPEGGGEVQEEIVLPLRDVTIHVMLYHREQVRGAK